MINKIIAALILVLILCPGAKADSFDEIIKGLDQPYAVTLHQGTGVRCVWTMGQHGFLQSENFANEGTGLCWSKESLDAAEAKQKKGTLTWNGSDTSPTAFFTDLHNACFYGYMGKQTGDWETYLGSKYSKTISKYTGKAKPIEKLGRAFDFGKNVSSSPADCMFIAKRLMGGA